MHYYQHHIGDFIKATSCLSNDQMVSYLRLLWMYYDSENPLEDDPEVLALRSGAKPEDVRLILRAFFRLEDGVWRQSRCDREIEEYHAICERNTKNGKRGGRPKKKPSRFPAGSQSVSSGLPVGTQTEPSRNPDETLTSNHEPVTNISPISPAGDFAIFWETYPSKVGKGAAEKAFEKIAPAPDLLAQMLEAIGWQAKSKQWQDGFIPNPATWLNHRRWEDEPPKTSVVYLTGNGVAL